MRQIEDRGAEIVSEDLRNAYTEGVESVLYIRCMFHRAVPAYNSTEGMGECAACAVSKLEEQHAREIGNMAKDAFHEAALSFLSKAKTFGYCSFCNEILVCNTLEDARAKQREHLLECPEFRKALGVVVPAWIRESLLTAWDQFNAALPDGEYAGLGVMRMAIKELRTL